MLKGGRIDLVTNYTLTPFLTKGANVFSRENLLIFNSVIISKFDERMFSRPMSVGAL